MTFIPVLHEPNQPPPGSPSLWRSQRACQMQQTQFCDYMTTGSARLEISVSRYRCLGYPDWPVCHVIMSTWPDWCSEPSRNEGSVHSLARPADCAADIRDKGIDYMRRAGCGLSERKFHEPRIAIPRSRLTGLALLLCNKAVVFVAFDIRSKISTNRQGQHGPSWLRSCNTGIN